jgi:hypothetical protein
LQGHALECRIPAGEGGRHGADALLGIRSDCPAQRRHPHRFGFGGSGQLRVQRGGGYLVVLREQPFRAGQTGGDNVRSQAALGAAKRLLQRSGSRVPTDLAQGVCRCAG